MPVIADDHEDWRASPLFRLMRLLGVMLLALLLAYWLSFAVGSVGKLIVSGPHAVLAWYVHIQTEGDLSRHWSAGRFLAQQSVVLAATVGLWFAVGRRPARA